MIAIGALLLAEHLLTQPRGYASDVAGEPALSAEPDRPGAEAAKCG